MWAAASGPGFDPTAALAQQFSDLGIHEQAAPPPPQQVAPQQAPAQAPDPAHITEFASERYSVQPAWNGAASAFYYQPYQPPPASFFPAPASVQQQPSTLGSSRDREVDGGPNGTNYHSLPNPWKSPPSRPIRTSLWSRRGKRVYASDEKGLPSESAFEPPVPFLVPDRNPYCAPGSPLVCHHSFEAQSRPVAPPEPSHLLLLACPYLKYDPSKYSQRRGCRGAAFPTTHRLK